MALSAGTRLGSYEIQSPLGAGGMGEVYRAMQSNLGRHVAIKVLSQAVGADFERLRRFEQEARAASALNHPNIISIYDVGSDGPTSYIAMEYVDGKTLRAALQEGPLSFKKTLQIAAQLADGLAKAHAAGIVHRDLKPENVMLTRDGVIKILDFGLAKLAPVAAGAMSETLTANALGTDPGTVMGTVGYMSPEQARGSPVDFRSDIFSFGSVLYEMVTGRRPFKSESSAQTLAAIIEDEPQSIAELNPKTPLPLRWIIERCMAKDPEERYASTRDLASDLHSVRDHLSDTGTSSLATKSGAGSRWTWFKPLPWIAVGALAGALLAGVVLPRSEAHSPRLRTLTFSGTDLAPTVSPDGRTVAFVSGRDGKWRIWLKQLESGSEVALTPGPLDFGPHFSSDGDWILYVSGKTLRRVPSLGGDSRKVLDDVNSADWSPDGREVAFLRTETEGAKAVTAVGIASLLDGSSRIIHRFDNQQFGSPSWSPDGQTIALSPQARGNAGPVTNRYLLLLSNTGDKVRELDCPLAGGVLSSPAWSASGDEVIYGQPESAAEAGLATNTTVGSSGRMLAQNVRTGKVRVLFAVQAPLSRVEIAGAGRLIFDALVQRNNLREVSIAPTLATADRWLTRGNSIDRQPFYSPDGDSVVFSSSRSGDVDLWEVSTKTESLRRLTDHPAADWDPFVTRDGKYLLWSSNRTGPFEIWTADRDGSAPRQISHDGVDAENPGRRPMAGLYMLRAIRSIQDCGRSEWMARKRRFSFPAQLPGPT